MSPTGLTASEKMVPVAAGTGTPSGTGWAGSATSHLKIVLSTSLTSVRPSRLNTTVPNEWAGPVSGEPSWTGCAGSARYHSQTLPSPAPAARTVPFGLTATELTGLAGPVSLLDRGSVLVDSNRVLLSGVASASLAATSSRAAADGSVGAAWSAAVAGCPRGPGCLAVRTGRR